MIIKEEWKNKEDFTVFLNSLYEYQTCGIARNWDRTKNVLTVRGYGAYPKADYNDIKYLTNEEVALALEAGIEDWRR